MTFMVATNIVASRPPERRTTGTPHARANIPVDAISDNSISIQLLTMIIRLTLLKLILVYTVNNTDSVDNTFNTNISTLLLRLIVWITLLILTLLHSY